MATTVAATAADKRTPGQGPPASQRREDGAGTPGQKGCRAEIGDGNEGGSNNNSTNGIIGIIGVIGASLGAPTMHQAWP